MGSRLVCIKFMARRRLNARFIDRSRRNYCRGAKAVRCETERDGAVQYMTSASSSFVNYSSGLAISFRRGEQSACSSSIAALQAPSWNNSFIDTAIADDDDDDSEGGTVLLSSEF